MICTITLLSIKSRNCKKNRVYNIKVVAKIEQMGNSVNNFVVVTILQLVAFNLY